MSEYEDDESYDYESGEEMDEYDSEDDMDGYGEEPQAVSEVLNPDIVNPSPAPGDTSQVSMMKDFTSFATQAASSGDVGKALTILENFSKSQLSRFLDITVIGPLLLWWAYRGKLSATERAIMGVIGAGTLVYSYRSYKANKQILQPQELAHLKDQLQQKQAEMSGYYVRRK